MSRTAVIRVLIGEEPEVVRRAMSEFQAHEEDCAMLLEATKSRLHLRSDYIALVVWDVRDVGSQRFIYRLATIVTVDALLIVAPEMSPALKSFQADRTLEERQRTALESLAGLLLKITESYAQATDEVDRDAELIQRRVLLGPRRGLWHQAYAVRQRAFFLRRQVMRLSRMMDVLRPSSFVQTAAEHAAFEEVHGESEDLIDDLGEVLGSMADMVEANSAILDHRTNGIMKVLTVVSVIFMPPTLIASIYGMNFYIPEVHWRYGYAFSLLLMALLVAMSLAWMHFNGWLRRDD